MKKLISCMLLLSMLLTLCVCGASPAYAAEPEAEISASEISNETADPMALYRTGKPWPCIDLEGVVTEGMPAELKDNFALYVNRDFYINAEIPEGYYGTGTVSDLSIINSDDVIQLFADGNDYSDHDSRLAKAFYDLLLDWDTRNELGVSPLKKETDVIEAMTELDDLISYYLNYPIEKQLSSPFSAGMDTDIDDPEIYIATASSCGLMLGDSAEYSELTDLGELYLYAFHDLTVAMLEKLDYSEERAQEMWDEAYRFEELMAPHIYTSDERYMPDYISKIDNHMTRDELVALQGRMPVVESLELACGFGIQENWLVTNPGFFVAMSSIFCEENLPLIKSWIICRAARSFADSLDSDCYALSQACDIAITGVSPLPYEITAATITQGVLSWQTARMYCEKYFTQQDKDNVQTLIENIIDVYREMLTEESFLSDETKAAAINKLDSLRIRSLYPDDWSEYTDPELTFRSAEEGGCLIEAMEAIDRSYFRRLQEKVKHPINHELWSDSITPIIVNCFYNPSENSINILAAFCRGDVYSSDMSREELYAKMGVVIGHEITHAFDSSGAQFDETGAFKNWWTEEDNELFNEKVEKLADYYNNMTVWDDLYMNGDIMTGESCADMGAVKCMLTLAAKVEGFDYDAFFKSYADLWKEQDNMFLIQFAQKDPHPMSYVRINSTLQQFDEFLDFYGITEGDNMYLAPEDRVAIW